MEISELCTEENLVRRDFLSDTYRTRISVEGENVLCDIRHFQIPLPGQKEEELQNLYNLAGEVWNKEVFYHVFSQAVVNNITTSLEIKEKFKKEFEDPNDRSGAKYIQTLYFPKMIKRGKEKIDIYLVSDAAEHVRSAFFSEDGKISLLNVLQILKYATAGLMALEKKQIFLGLNEDNLYITYRRSINLKDYWYKTPEDFLRNARVLNPLFSDIRSISDFQALGYTAWRWCTGRNFEEKSIFSETEISDELKQLLLDYIQGREKPALLGRRVVDLIEEISNGKVENLLLPKEVKDLFLPEEKNYGEELQVLREYLGLSEFPYEQGLKSENPDERFGDNSSIMRNRIKEMESQVDFARPAFQKGSIDWKL